MVKQLFENKRAVLFVSLLAVLSLTVLASALNNLSFRPAQSIYRAGEEPRAAQISVREIVGNFLEIPFWKQAVFLAAIVLIFTLLTLLLSPEMRKRLFRLFIRVAVSVGLLYYLLTNNPEILKGIFAPFDFPVSAAEPAMGGAALPVFEPPQISDGFSFFVTLGILLAAAIFAWRFYAWWSSLSGLENPSRPLDEIAKVARASLRELSQPQASAHNAIIKCYENMSQVVDRRRGLYRSYAMTAAEFAYKLENAGLPREPVGRLTRLFESARYSARASTQSDMNEAVSCLTSILNYCGEKS